MGWVCAGRTGRDERRLALELSDELRVELHPKRNAAKELGRRVDSFRLECSNKIRPDVTRMAFTRESILLHVTLACVQTPPHRRAILAQLLAHRVLDVL